MRWWWNFCPTSYDFHLSLKYKTADFYFFFIFFRIKIKTLNWTTNFSTIISSIERNVCIWKRSVTIMKVWGSLYKYLTKNHNFNNSWLFFSIDLMSSITNLVVSCKNIQAKVHPLPTWIISNLRTFAVWVFCVFSTI